MHVKATVTPASAPGGHTWEDENVIREVPDALGTDLLRIAGQFVEVLPTDPEHPHYVAPEETPADEDDPEPEVVELEEPPRTGPLASKKAWQEYATSKNVDYPEGASRDDIIKLVDTRNLIAE